jgi:1-acyl-sn-glycerol-3-phosphate acyltransferase
MRQIRRGVEALPPNASLVVFPEGTRSPEERPLPFKKGGFLLALNSGTAILPVTVRNSGRIWGKGHLFLRPGTIEVEVHPLIQTAGRPRSDAAALMTEVREVIVSGLDLDPDDPS